MRRSLNISGTPKRSKTTLYLRRDLKCFARQASFGQGQTLSRYLESLLVSEFLVSNSSPDFSPRPGLSSQRPSRVSI
jgi:hypothetical protein